MNPVCWFSCSRAYCIYVVKQEYSPLTQTTHKVLAMRMLGTLPREFTQTFAPSLSKPQRRRVRPSSLGPLRRRRRLLTSLNRILDSPTRGRSCNPSECQRGPGSMAPDSTDTERLSISDNYSCCGVGTMYGACLAVCTL